MKIFSNFDTKFRTKIYNENCAKYWSDSVLVFGRSRLYWLLKVLSPTILLILFNLFWLLLYYHWTNWLYFIYILAGTIAIDIFVIAYIGWKYIDYLLDFMLVIPNSLVLYIQKWCFERDVFTMNQISIKTISVEKRWFWYSVFNNWDITILSEWIPSDIEEKYWKVVLKRVAKPEYKREKIIKTLWLTNKNS